MDSNQIKYWVALSQVKGLGAVRFRKLEDLPLELVGEAVSRISAEEYIRLYEASRPAKGASRRRRR